jgi:flagellin-like protein
MKGKRGISPIVATVLLIAFAAALGVLIINITTKLGTASCEGKIELAEVIVCRLENVVKLSAKNLGPESLDSLLLKLDEGHTTWDISFEGLNIKPQGRFSKELSFKQLAEETKFLLIPKISKGENKESVECKDMHYPNNPALLEECVV